VSAVPPAGPPRAPGAASEREVDLGQAAVLLRAYLRLSLRRGSAGFASMRRRGGGTGLWGALAFYVLFGVVMGTTAWQGMDLFTYALLVHSVTFFAVASAMSLVAGDVILNPGEADVLGFRPVSAATLLLAKGANLGVFALVLATALNVVPMFTGLAVRGARPWFPVVHWLGSAVLALFCAALLVLLYAALMRFVRRDLFERVATWAQIVLSFGIVAGTQVVPRLTERYPGLSLVSVMGWLSPLPPTWFAALDGGLAGPRAEPAMLALGLGGCALTAALFAVSLWRLAPAWGAGTAEVAEARAVAPGRPGARRGPLTTVSPLLGLWMRDPVERTAYRLATTYMLRDREVMLRLYPAVGPLLAPLLIPLFDTGSRRGGVIGLLIMATVMLGFLPGTVMATLELSTQHPAAEVFRRAPLADAAGIFHGVRKAVVLWVLLPMVLIVGVLGLVASHGRAGVLLSLLPGFVLLPTFTLLPALGGPWVPFSLPPMRGTRSQRIFGTMLPSLLVLGGAYAAGEAARRGGFLPLFLAGEVAVVAVVHGLLLMRVRAAARIEPAEA